MSEGFLGEIRVFAFGVVPKGWALCNGQLLSINQNQALYSILGNTYGGDGVQTFGLPNLQGRMPMHVGSGATWGQAGGESAHTLTTAEMPAHQHQVNATTAAASTGDPTGALWASTAAPTYGTTPDSTMSGAALGTAGSSAPHQNMPPYLAVSLCIALVGIYPSRN